MRETALVHYAAAILKARQSLRSHFQPDLFGDPALNIMLALYTASDDRPLSVSDAVASSGEPGSTGLRWVSILEQRGLVNRKPDANDKRRSFVSLSAKARMSMAAWLQETRARTFLD